MSLNAVAPGIEDATIFEVERNLVLNNTTEALQRTEDRKIEIYPSIEFTPLIVRTDDHVGPAPEENDWQKKLYASFLAIIHWPMKEYGLTLDQIPPYRIGKSVYNIVNEKFNVKIVPPADHPLFSPSTNSIKCISWHPHKDVIAVAHSDDKVYVYEKTGNTWSCNVLDHPYMTNITCLEWKAKASGTLAVGCHNGVCVWGLFNDNERPSAHFENAGIRRYSNVTNTLSGKRHTVRFHSNAWMNYFCYPNHTHISSLAWDPSPGSHALVAASAVSSILVIYDTLTLQTVPIKRYGKGNIMVRWSPDGEWLYASGTSGMSRMWETHNWTSTEFINPPGLWVQAACWAPDSRGLFYSMHGKSEVHLLYRSGSTMSTGVWNIKALSTPPTETKLRTGESVTIGGTIKDISLDPTNGQRLAVAYENSDLIALYEAKPISLSLTNENIQRCLSFIGYMRGSLTVVTNNTENIQALAGAKPLHVAYARSFSGGALLATVWENNIVSFLAQRFVTDEEQRKKY